MLTSIVSFCVLWIIAIAETVSFEEMYADCKDDYTCLMYPKNCATLRNCDLVAIIQKFQNNYRFRLLGKGPYYVAAGISKDRAMGEDAVVFCTEDIVGTAINVGGRNRTILSDWKPDIGNVDMKIENGRIVCAFDIPSRFTVEKLRINLVKPKYLLLATGPRQHPPHAQVPFAGHAIKLSSYHPLLFGVGRAIKGRMGGGGSNSESGSPFIGFSNILLFSTIGISYMI